MRSIWNEYKNMIIYFDLLISGKMSEHEHVDLLGDDLSESQFRNNKKGLYQNSEGITESCKQRLQGVLEEIRHDERALSEKIDYGNDLDQWLKWIDNNIENQYDLYVNSY